MLYLQLHPDNRVMIKDDADDAVRYEGTPAEFEAEYGVPFPLDKLPAGFTGQIYMPGVKHQVSNGRKAVALDLEWPEGDAVLAAVGTLETKMQTRRQEEEEALEESIRQTNLQLREADRDNEETKTR